MTAPAQFVLPLKDLDRALLASGRVLAAARAVAKTLSYKAVADMWGLKDPDGDGIAVVTQKLGESNGRAVKPHELLALMAVDSEGRVLAALCDALGYETPERKAPVQSDAERELHAFREICGPEIQELAKRKAGL